MTDLLNLRAATLRRPDPKIGDASKMVSALRQKTKREVFDLFCVRCLGRVHAAKIEEQHKGVMIYDIVAAIYGHEIAVEVA